MTQEDVEKQAEEPEEAEGVTDEQPEPDSEEKPRQQAEEPEEPDTEESAGEQAVSTPEQQPEVEAVEQQPDTVEAEEAEPAEEAAEEEAAAAEKKAGKPAPVLTDEKPSKKRWYVIHAHSGHENKVKQSIENRVRQERLQDIVSRVLVPSEEVAEVKGGKKRITSRKIFPGYVLVEMELTHQTWYMIRTTPGVTGFIGSGKMPTPLEAEEVESIFEQMRGEQKKPKPKVEFEKDERVKIIEGPFTNFMGSVDEVNAERGKLKVMVEIFERLTSVELEFWQVEKT